MINPSEKMTGYNSSFENHTFYDEHDEWIADHVDSYFPDADISVFHEIMALDIRVHVYLIKPKGASFQMLLTSGMSTLKMNVSEGVGDQDEQAFAELMMLIPKHIEFAEVYSGDKPNDWILTVLKRTAKFPHFYNTWIGIGHSIQADEDYSPYGEDTEYVGALVLPSVTFDERFTEIKKDGRTINIYSVLPLYRNELEYKIEHGYNDFLDLLIQANGKEILDLKRKNLIPKKSFWNRFIK